MRWLMASYAAAHATLRVLWPGGELLVAMWSGARSRKVSWEGRQIPDSEAVRNDLACPSMGRDHCGRKD